MIAGSVQPCLRYLNNWFIKTKPCHSIAINTFLAFNGTLKAISKPRLVKITYKQL